MMDTRFVTKKFRHLTDTELQACSELYSNNYGVYSGLDHIHAKGERIRMSAGFYKRLYESVRDVHVSLCYKEDRLLGHTIFLLKDIKGKGRCSWVLQLVVDKRYRGRGIGSKLLFSAWGFSDFFAWGLATANAITLKTLEAATWRKITVQAIADNIDTLEEIMESVPFVDKKSVKLSTRNSQIFSNFFPELEASNHASPLKVYTTRLGKIKPGHEWLAFTFSTQPINFTPERFKTFMEFSDQQLKEAYSRMNMPSQAWTKGTSNEVDFILENAPVDQNSRILDLGCGQGRHLIELTKRGYQNTLGVDFSESNVAKARQVACIQQVSTNFVCADARKIRLGVKQDLILCLYDVIGSFRKEEDNRRIIRTIKHNLKKGGHAIVSVMNMELTEAIAINRDSVSAHPEALLRLPPSETMESSGNVFKPEYFLINTDDGLVYRKEQFTSGEELFSEYLVADRRYSMNEITALFKAEGLTVKDCRYVQAGHWDTPLSPTDVKAKEILLCIRKE